jgi:Transmembrane secretion effector
MPARALGVTRSRGVLGAALRRPPFATVFAGYLVSALGDGMAVVAIQWMANSLAHGRHTGLWVGAAVAAYTLPGVLAGFGLGRLFSACDGRLLILAEATLRAGCLATVAGLALLGLLLPCDYVALLGLSSLLGLAVTTGELVSVTELLPPEQHVAGNSLVTVTKFGATLVGPPLAGLLIVTVGPATVIAVGAATYVALIATTAVSRCLHRPPCMRRADRMTMVGALRALAHEPAVLGISLLCVWSSSASTDRSRWRSHSMSRRFSTPPPWCSGALGKPSPAGPRSASSGPRWSNAGDSERSPWCRWRGGVRACCSARSFSATALTAVWPRSLPPVPC